MFTTKRTLLAGIITCTVMLNMVVFLVGFSDNTLLRLLETAAVVAAAVLVLSLAVGAVITAIARWHAPKSDEEFEQVVERAEQLARDDLAAEPEESDFLALDPLDDHEFAAIVQEAINELPDILHRALEKNVAVTIRNDGHKHKAYGMYVGDGVARDNAADRIIIYRDTLRRDFGHNENLLREQIVRTLRHELAHHLGASELGVRDLGL